MTSPAQPFAVPELLPPALAQALAYWEGLKRGSAETPFWDDLDLADLPGLGDRLALVEMFEKPRRFRLEIVGSSLAEPQGEAIAGRFLDEADLKPPLAFLHAQCSVAAEAMAPTFMPLAADPSGATGRLVLPLWGEGQVRMLLAVVG